MGVLCPYSPHHLVLSSDIFTNPFLTPDALRILQCPAAGADSQIGTWLMDGEDD